MRDQLFEKYMKQSFAMGEIRVLGVDKSGGYFSAVGDGREDDDETGGGGNG